MSQSHEEPRVFQPGDVFRQHYLVERFIAAGASGQVYAVRHTFTGDRFALKTSHLKDRGKAKAVDRALAEARAGYGLSHANVARVFELACEANGMVWQRMELLSGKTVAELLAGSRKFSPLYAIDIASEAACGLQAIHEQQIIHRDVQPSNIFVTTGGQVKVIDFSFAKVLAAGIVTTNPHTMGTSGYMAPEHLRNAAPTPQFDVYALGIMLWEMTAGRHPFKDSFGDRLAMVERQLSDRPESLTRVAALPSYIDEVILRATALDPRERYEGMWPLSRALRELRQRLVGDPDAARFIRHPPAWEKRSPIYMNPAGWASYQPPSPLPKGEAAPPLPVQRILVAPPRPGEPSTAEPPPSSEVAPTALPSRPAPPAAPLLELGAPGEAPSAIPRRAAPAENEPATRRRWSPGSRRGLWVALVLAPVLVVLAVAVVLLARASSPSAGLGAPPPRPSSDPLPPAARRIDVAR